jgi:hypothetical protein
MRGAQEPHGKMVALPIMGKGESAYRERRISREGKGRRKEVRGAKRRGKEKEKGQGGRGSEKRLRKEERKMGRGRERRDCVGMR